jgi:hypothetical protein
VNSVPGISHSLLEFGVGRGMPLRITGDLGMTLQSIRI